MNELDLIRKGDSSAIVSIYKNYRKEFYRWIMKLHAIDSEDAEEIFQMSVVTFYENVINHKLDDLKSSVKTYLFAIGKYKAMELFRKKNRLQPLENLASENEELDIAFNYDEDGPAEDHELRLAAIGKSMDALGKPCSEIITLFYFQKLSLSMIGEKLGYKSEESIKSQKFKCMERLRKIYFEHYRQVL